jgi:hypothetical protein
MPIQPQPLKVILAAVQGAAIVTAMVVAIVTSCGRLYSQALPPADVLTQHNDNLRTGHYTTETLLTPAVVRSPKFLRLADFTLPDCITGSVNPNSAADQIYAQPLYVRSVQVRTGYVNVLFVATQHNCVFAFYADSGKVLWMRSLGPPVPVTSLKASFVLINPFLGITSTPAIDRTRNSLYVVSMTPNTPSVDVPAAFSHTLYDLDLFSGTIKNSKLIRSKDFAPIPGTGGGSLAGELPFDPFFQINRASLLLQNSMIYVAFGGSFERFPYHGWVFSYNVASLAPVSIYATNPDGTGAGIWQSGNGLAGDGSSIFVSTGQGGDETKGAYEGPLDSRGSSVIKLSANLKEMDWFLPFNQQCLDTCDLDLATAGPVLLPGLQRLLAGGKEGRIYLLDTNNLGHGPVPQDSQIQGCFKATEDQNPDHAATAHTRCESTLCVPGTWMGEANLYPHIHGSPVVWTEQLGSRYRVYVQGESDRLKAFRFDKGTFHDKSSRPLDCFPLPGNAAPFDQSDEIAPYDTMPGGILALSSNNQQVGTVILWVSIPIGGECGGTGDHPCSAEDGTHLVTGKLRAYNAENLRDLLWEQTLDSKHYVKFVPPTIAGGNVYMAGIGRVAVFGLGTPTSFTKVKIKIDTGHDNAREDSELWLKFAGTPAFCLKPSNNASPSAVCPTNGGSAPEWPNFSSSTQTFNLSAPTVLDTSTMTISLIEHNSNGETDDNWDIQGITVTGIDSLSKPTLLLDISNKPSGDNCIARLKGPPNPSSVSYVLSASNPTGRNLKNPTPTSGPTPPGSCPQ